MNISLTVDLIWKKVNSIHPLFHTVLFLSDLTKILSFYNWEKKISNIFHGFRSSVSDFEQITVSVVKETTKCSSLQEKFLMSDEETISIK